MDYVQAVGLLEKYGVKVISGSIARDKREAKKAAAKMGFPVVLKVVSKEISHKSDKGCVRVGITSEKTLEHAFDEIIHNAGSAKVDGVLVQKMARKGVELIVGGKRDAQFGPLVIFGLGGVFVEVLRDVSIRICPITEQDADEMIREIKTYPLLTGVRGTLPSDVTAIRKLLMQVSKLMVKEEKVKELDLNPVIVHEKGYDVVDVRIVE
ncbi:acetate--CoA ligase family protein [Candidatus Micrarchaeota archaeon]|nr:acetate--CoA ligase family protein [Candidatus Micrarchaeota archaeon]